MNKKANFPVNVQPVSVEWLNTVNAFDSQELLWLSGYCKGLVKGRSDQSFEPLDSSVINQSKASQSNNVPLKTLVLYGSQTGNSRRIAELLFDNLDKISVPVDLVNVSDFNLKNLALYPIILLIISTHGEGEPPDDAIDFYDLINSQRVPKLDNTQHAVFGLGDSSYEFFCQTGKKFDKALIKLGSKSLIERVDCDLDYEVKVKQWINRLVEKMTALASLDELSFSDGNDLDKIDTPLDGAQYTKENPLTATILSNQKITGKGSSKCIHHIEMSLENSGIQYLPGDSIGVWAKNNLQLVDGILNLTSLDGEEFVSIKNDSKSLRLALLENFEITLINKDFIGSYSELVALTNKQDAEKLLETILPDYSSYIKNHQIIDVIALAPIPLKAQKLADLLKPIKPRIYSLSSSLESNEKEAHITVGLKETFNDNAIRRGVASEFLIERLEENEEVLVFVEHNKRFKLPADDQPIIMIGPGTGIAPFRAFLQQRNHRLASGENWLFFGNPHFNTDFLYQLELQKYYQQGLLTHLDLAFSRDQKEKIYVQERLLDNATNIWQWIENKKATLYVCGDMNRMAKDVEHVLLKIISEQGDKSTKQAKDYLKILRKENRYQRDVY